MDVELGIIEGFYGKPWTWAEREETIAFLAPHGYGFYLYAPKADPYLRRHWRNIVANYLAFENEVSILAGQLQVLVQVPPLPAGFETFTVYAQSAAISPVGAAVLGAPSQLSIL